MLVEATDESVVRTIAASLGMEYIIAIGRKSSLALLTRLPIVTWNKYEPPGLGRPLLAAALQTAANQQITLYGIHLQCHYFRHNERRRVRELTAYLKYIASQPPHPHLLLGDFNAIAPGDDIGKDGLPLFERLMLWWERGQVYHDAINMLINAGYKDCFRALHPNDAGATLPVHAPHVRLDYIFADPAMYQYLTQCEVISTSAAQLASDHFPVLAEFSL
jgi:exodeoxyribonuclease III